MPSFMPYQGAAQALAQAGARVGVAGFGEAGNRFARKADADQVEARIRIGAAEVVFKVTHVQAVLGDAVAEQEHTLVGKRNGKGSLGARVGRGGRAAAGCNDQGKKQEETDFHSRGSGFEWKRAIYVFRLESGNKRRCVLL